MCRSGSSRPCQDRLDPHTHRPGRRRDATTTVVPTMPAAALPTGLPGLPMAAPAPAVERSIEEVSSAWGQAVQDGKIDPAKALELYAQLGIDGSKLASSVEMRGKLYDHLASL